MEFDGKLARWKWQRKAHSDRRREPIVHWYIERAALHPEKIAKGDMVQELMHAMGTGTLMR
jgi:hypothetical protein